MEAGSVVKVIRDFLTLNEGELSVLKHDILQITEVVDRHWVTCQGYGGVHGLVPKAYIHLQDHHSLPSNLEPGHCLLVCGATFETDTEGDLPLSKGDLVIGLEEVDVSWMRGRSLADGRVGIFPTSFTWKLDADLLFGNTSAKAKVEKFAQVVHSMQALLSEEIDLVQGQIVRITEIVDKDWYRGEGSDGRSGIFPSSFVRIIDAFPGDAPPDSADLSSYLKQPQRSAADYMNTRNAFHGLEENLKALNPAPTPPKLTFKSKSLIEEDDYFKINLPPTYGSEPDNSFVLEEDEDTTVLGLAGENCPRGYENMVKNLSVFANAEARKQPTKLVTPYSYQTITMENLGYSGANVDVRPYGIVKYHFVAEFNNELGLDEGDMVYILRYVNNEWLEAELDSNRRGLVPISYINIIVDLMSSQREMAVTVHENLVPDTYHKVLYTFQGQMEGDLSVGEGEVVRICEKQNDDWYVVENSTGEAGLFPGNHLDPNAEFSGKALFDIEQLLAFSAPVPKLTPPVADPEKKSDDKAWKFFDPLSSPCGDDELIRLEAKLEEKAKKANQQLVLEQKPDIIASTEVRSRQPRDIDSLISNNLSKLRSLSPRAKPQNDGSNLTYDRLDVAKSVLVELRGKTKRKPPPPLPPQPSPRPSRPPEPPKVKPRRPPAPKVDLMDVNCEIIEPVYASVKKEPSRPVKPPRDLEVTVDVEVHQHHYDNTPTNGEMRNLTDKANEDDPDIMSHNPSVPIRTSSILPRPSLISKGETFRSYINLKDLEPPAVFPPDKNSPMSPPASKEEPSRPPKVTSLPFRSVSVASSIKSRSIFYPPTDRGESPWCSSLNHSYETLNTVDSGSEIDPTATPIRNPHRPAPPVPASASPLVLRKSASNDEDAIVPAESSADMDDDNLSLASKNRRKIKHQVSRRILRQRKIHSLKRQIQIKEKMLEEQLLRELDMYQEIAVAKGAEYDRLNQKMDGCQENIETLSDEIQRLQACLADEELQAEEESIEELRRKDEEERFRAQLEAQKRDEERRVEEARRKKNKERREHVVGELLMTEREFCRDLKLTWQAFGLDTPEVLEQRGVDVKGLFGNINEIIEVSSAFLDSLAKEEGDVGKAFLANAEAMKNSYTEYCVNHDKAEQLLEKYEGVPEVQKLLQRSVETLQSQVVCFNMGSILIKPVQRILKYPLMLNELIKCTEQENDDKKDLMEAVTIMADVAAFINESKRRKDIVDKYKSEEEKTLTRKISKLNMHSIGKKSTRMGTRFLTSIGIESTIKDCDFDDLEKRYSYLTRYIQLFSSDAQSFRKQLHETVICQFNVAQNVADLYKERVHAREVERFRTAHKNILATHWNEFNGHMENRVIRPLQQLIETFQAPSRLITKRQDKHIDFSASTQRAEKNKDPSKNKLLQDDVAKCKSTYEALNSQLMEELPTLLEVAKIIFLRVIAEFLFARKILVGRITRELLSLMDLPLLASTSGDILEVFLVKHSLVCNQLGRFSFSSKAFRPDESKAKRNMSSPTHQGSLGQPSSDVPLQSSGVRTFLRGKYASAKLYQANVSYTPIDVLDIGVNPGDLVGVIQTKDPMGNSKRWFVDNGVTQGFLPANILNPIGSEPDPVNEAEDTATSAEVAAEKVNAYDDVAPEDVPAENEDKKPVRKAPPVPKKPSDQQSNHSYEEIAASEVNSEVSQDLSPIYEEIHGCSRSSVSSGSSSNRSTSNSSTTSSSSERGKFFYSMYDFEATDATMLSAKRGQVLRVLQSSSQSGSGNAEWCYVEDRHGNKGYVPISYLNSYQEPSSSTAAERNQSSNSNLEQVEEEL